MPTIIYTGPNKTQHQANWIDVDGARRRRRFPTAHLARKHEARMRIAKHGDQLRRAAELALHHEHRKEKALRALIEGEFTRQLALIKSR